jgi:hypothetical protein
MRSLTLAAAALLALSLSIPALSQETEAQEPEGWNVASDINLTLTQNAYSDNWTGGETGGLSWTLNSNTLAERQLTPGLHLRNVLKLSFGQTHSQDEETKEWARPVKSTDQVDLDSVLRFTRGWVVDPFLSGRVETHFLDVSDPEKSRALNPIVFTEGAGIARVFIKEENREWVTRLGGAFRQHMDRDALQEGATERETVTTSDAGAEFVSEFRTPLADGAITLTSDLTVYQALYYSESDELEGLPNEDDWKSPDINWENTFAASITEHLVVNLYVQLLYDKEIDDDPRFKETLSLGFTFRLL